MTFRLSGNRQLLIRPTYGATGLRAVVWTLAIVAVLSAHTFAFAQEPKIQLRDQECGSQPVLVDEVAGMRIHAICSTSTSGEARIVTFTVVGNSTRLLMDFSIGFCAHPVISVQSPRGWKGVTTDGRVGWNAVDDPAAEKRNGQSGFSVVLKPGWRLSPPAMVSWQNDDGGRGGAVGSSVSHACD